MNKRIEALKEQAFAEPDMRVAVLDKFAELIVKECCQVIVNGGYWSGGPLGPKRQCTPPEIATMIKDHFGVKDSV